MEIEVLPNEAPNFMWMPTTSFEMEVGEHISYEIPPVYDPDDNSVPVVYIGTDPNYSG